MNWEIIITAIITIAVAVPGFITLRKEAATKIYYIEEDQINFYEKLVKDFRDIKITFKDKPINEKFFLLRGFIFCSGSKDITRENITKPINVQLEEKSVWHYVKIISTSPDLAATESISKPNELLVELPLIKNGDFIYFEALGESEKEDYTPGYRIANVPPIIAEGINRRHSRRGLILAYIFILIVSCILIFSDFGSGQKIRKLDVDPVYTDKQNKKIAPPTSINESKSGYDSIMSLIYDSVETYNR